MGAAACGLRKETAPGRAPTSPGPKPFLLISSSSSLFKIFTEREMNHFKVRDAVAFCEPTVVCSHLL